MYRRYTRVTLAVTLEVAYAPLACYAKKPSSSLRVYRRYTRVTLAVTLGVAYAEASLLR